jgi:hypothetical protein
MRDLIHELTEARLSPEAWIERFYRKRPKLGRYRPRVRFKDGHGSGGHGEARQHGDEIWLFPKFWKLPAKTREFVFAHELGHYALSGRYSEMMKVASTHGVDVWDTPSLPYGQFNGEEAFADCFAAYHVAPRELKTRYPAWVEIVKALL